MIDKEIDWMTEDEMDTVEAIDYALPLVVSPGTLETEAESLDDVFAGITSRLSQSEAESFGSALRQVGQWLGKNEQVGKLAGQVLPAAGTAIGAVYGGPAGAAIGQAIGERASQAVAGGKPRPAPPGSPPAPPASVATTSAATTLSSTTLSSPPTTPPDGSTAAAQLLYLVQNPSFLSSLIALAIGSRGRASIPTAISGTEVPVGAFVNAATSLANEAAQDADAIAAEAEVLDSYLRDDEGAFICDPAVPSERTRSLLQLLQREDEALYALDEAYEPPVDEFYDDLDF